MEIKIEYLYSIPNTYNLVLNGAWHCSTVGLGSSKNKLNIFERWTGLF